MRSLADDLGVVAQHMVLPVDLRGGLPSLAGRWEGFGEEEEEPMEGADPAPLERLAAAERSFAQRRERFLRFASSVGRGAGNRPSFHFLHSMLPHYDWEYLPSGRNYPRASFMPGLEGELRFTKDRARVERIYQRHLLQVEFVDRLLGRLLRRLRATGRYDQTLIVVTADHGATFRPGLPLLGWSGRDPADILPVPLFIKAPGQRRGREVDAHIQTVDILPTVAGLLDLDIPWKVDGRSALARSADRSGGLLHHPGRQPRRFSSRVFDESYRNALRHKMSLFGPGKGIYAVGPRQSLLGRRLRDLSLAAPTRLRAEVHRPESYGAVDMRSTFVPAHVSGRLTGRQAGASRDLLIAVNGRIAAAARAARVLGSDESHFSAIVPEKFFRQGANRVQVLAVSATGELTPLASIRPRQVDYSLGGGEIRVSNGASIKIADGALEGFVDSSKDEGDAVAFGGWALPRRGRSPADRILAFGGGRLVYAGAPKLERMDVAKAKRTTARGLGFRFSLPKETATRGVRVFAVEGRRASELRFYCKDRARQVTGC
jgi:hypothetical protein